jgi:hypothetical protein
VQLEADLAARSEEQPKTDTLERKLRQLEERHRESERECESLREQLQTVRTQASTDGPAAPSADKPARPTQTPIVSELFSRRRNPRERAAGSETQSSHASANPGDVASQQSPSAEQATSPAQKPAQASHGAETESVESYMERLLARSRKSGGIDAPWLQAPARGTVVDARREERGADDADVAERPVVAAPAPALPLPEPSHRQDKASVRADLDSLRNVANTAARSAIAKYSSRATREKLLYRSLLTTLAVLITLVLLSSMFWGDGSYVNLGWLGAAASAAMGFDVLRTSGKLRSAGSKGDRALARTKPLTRTEAAKPEPAKAEQAGKAEKTPEAKLAEVEPSK